MLNTLKVHWNSSFAIFFYSSTPRFHDQAPVFSRLSAICEYGVFIVVILMTFPRRLAQHIMEDAYCRMALLFLKEGLAGPLYALLQIITIRGRIGQTNS